MKCSRRSPQIKPLLQLLPEAAKRQAYPANTRDGFVLCSSLKACNFCNVGVILSGLVCELREEDPGSGRQKILGLPVKGKLPSRFKNRENRFLILRAKAVSRGHCLLELGGEFVKTSSHEIVCDRESCGAKLPAELINDINRSRKVLLFLGSDLRLRNLEGRSGDGVLFSHCSQLLEKQCCGDNGHYRGHGSNNGSLIAVEPKFKATDRVARLDGCPTNRDMALGLHPPGQGGASSKRKNSDGDSKTSFHGFPLIEGLADGVSFVEGMS